MTEIDPTPFPIGSRVILHSLTKAEYNGKVGLVKSSLNAAGRQQVSLDDSESGGEVKVLGLKCSNLKYEPRSIDSLSVKEMKIILKEKARIDGDKLVNDDDFGVTDKSQLKELVGDKVTSDEEVACLLYNGLANVSVKTPPASSQTNDSFREQVKSRASQIANMNPEQLRAQARMMRSMDTASIRRMNPMMANFTDAQIQMAISQMEMVANDPEMMKNMVKEVQNMGNTPASTNPTLSEEQIQTGMDQMSKMSPDQIQQQVDMMKSMDKSTLRSMNPAMANLTDAQINMAITQMEMMAKNPETLKTVTEQVKNMKSNGLFPSSSNNNGVAMPQDPMELLKNTSPEQIKQMVKMMKENPSMMREMIKSTNPSMADNLTDEQISKSMDMFENMDERKIGWVLSFIGWIQKARTHSRYLFIVFVISIISLVYFIYNKKYHAQSQLGGDALNDLSNVPVVTEEEDEFGNTEF